jgi:hypothetical protein
MTKYLSRCGVVWKEMPQITRCGAGVSSQYRGDLSPRIRKTGSASAAAAVVSSG